MDNDTLIEGVINNKCHGNYHVKNINYYCKNHNELFCENCYEKKEICKILEFNYFKDEQKSQIKENQKILEKFSALMEEKNDKLKNIYEQIKNNINKLLNDINLIFSSLINEILNKKNQLLLSVQNKYDILLFEKSLKYYENIHNDI